MKKFALKAVVAASLGATTLPAVADPITVLYYATLGFNVAWQTTAALAMFAVSTAYSRRKMKRNAAEARAQYNSQLVERPTNVLSAVPAQQYVYGRATVGASIHAMFTSDKVVARGLGIGSGNEPYKKRDALHHLVYVFTAHEISEVHDVFINGESCFPLDADGYSTNSAFRLAEAQRRHGEFVLAPGASYTSDVPLTVVDAVYDLGGDNGWGVATYTLSTDKRTITNTTDGYTINVTVEFTDSVQSAVKLSIHLGSPDQTVDAGLNALFPDKWTANHRLRGRFYIVATVDLEHPPFQSGPPALTADISGMKVLDVRTNVTTYSANPALCIRHFLMSKHGASLQSSDINSEYVIAAANACDTTIPINDPSYTDLVTYGFASGVQSFAVSGGSITATGGALRLTSSGGAAKLSRVVSFNGATHRYLRMRLRRTSGTGWRGVVRYSTSSHGYDDGFRNEQSFGFVNGEWREIVYDMHTLTAGGANWSSNTITGIELQLDSVAGDVFEIDWLSLSQYVDTATTGPKYQLSAVFSSDESREQVLENMAAAMGGSVYNSGDWLIVAGTWTAPVRDYTDSDLMGQIEILKSDTPIDDLANSGRATYYPQSSTTPTELDPPYVNSALVTEDTEALWEDIPFAYVSSPQRVRNLLRMAIEKTRNGQVIRVPLGLQGLETRIGDRIRITSEEYGFNLKTYRVTDWSFGATSPVVLVCQEDTADTYDTADLLVGDPTPNTNLPPPFLTPRVTGLAAYSGTTELAVLGDGTIQVRVRVEWDSPVDPYLLRGGGNIQVQWRRAHVDATDAWNTDVYPADNAGAYIVGPIDRDVVTIRARYVGALFTGEYSTISHTVQGKSAPPSDVTGLTASAGTNSVYLAWDACPDLDYGETEIRVGGTTWETATLAFRGKAKNASITSLTADTYVFRAKNTDTSGNYSVGTAVVSGVVVSNAALPPSYYEDPRPVYATPPTPTALTATGGLRSVVLSWELESYRNHSRVEVWRATTNSRTSASKVGESTSNSFINDVGASTATFYYWVRAVNVEETAGAYNAGVAGGVAGTRTAVGGGDIATDAVTSVHILADSILDTDLVAALRARVDLIDGPSSLPNSVNARISTETTERVSAIAAETAARSAAISAETSARASAIAALAAVKNRTFYQTSAPVSDANYTLQTNDTWVDTDDSNKTYRWNGTVWVSADDARIATLVADLSAETASRVSGDTAEVYAREALYAGVAAGTGTDYKIFHQATQPTGTTIGDVWTWKTAAGVETFSRWNGTTWVNSTSNKRAAVYRGEYANTATLPSSGNVIGDLARQTDTNEIKVWNGTSWVVRNTTLSPLWAFVESEKRARVDGDAAEASARTTLAARVTSAESAITTEQSVRASADSALSTSVETLNAISTGYESRVAWNFDSSVEGFTSPAGASLSNVSGAARIVSSSTTPILRSPDSIGVAGATYASVRARIRRNAGTGWKGTVYYKTTARATESESHKKVISTDPTVLNQWRTVEWDMVGSGDWDSSTVSQLRFDLGSSSGDSFDIDWITVGRVAPYAARAILETNYYTKTATDSAIASATTGLASQTYVNTQLGSYTTTASLQTNYYTKTATDSAIASATTGLASQTYVNTQLGSYTTTAWLQTNYYTKTDTDSAIASATSALASQTYVNTQLGSYTTTASLQTNYYTKTATDSAIASATSTLASANNAGAITDDPELRNPTRLWSYAPDVSVVAGSVNNRSAFRSTLQRSVTNLYTYPIDATKSYRASGRFRSGGGAAVSRTAYLLVELLDGSGNNIGGDGSYWYYPPPSGSNPGTNWVEWSGLFGAGTSRAVPSNATHMRVGAILFYDSTGSAPSGGWHECESLRIDAAEAAVVSSSLQTNYYTKTATDSAIASATTTLQSSINSNTTSIQQNTSSIDGVRATYTVKIDSNGVLSGFGLMSAVADNGSVVSDFFIKANTFAVIAPNRVAGQANSVPFAVISTARTINGVSFSPGVYIHGDTVIDGTLVASKIDTRNLTIKDSSGNVIFGASQNLDWSRLQSQPSNIYNYNVSLSSTGALLNAGGGQITSVPTVDSGYSGVFGARNRNDAPGDYPVGNMRQFKESAAIGLPSSNTYCTLETIKQYGDISGGGVYQYAYDGTKTWRRFAPNPASTDANTWQAWAQDLDRNAYTGSLDATRDLQMTLSSKYTQAGNRITQTSGSDGWDSSAVSPVAYSGGAFIESTEVLQHSMIGLSTSSTTTTSYQEIDFAFHSAGGGTYYIYERGAGVFGPASAPSGARIGVYYDGTTVRYMVNNTVVRQRGASLGAPVRAVVSLYYRNHYVEDLRFGPLSANQERNLLNARTWKYGTYDTQVGFPVNGTTSGGHNYITLATLPNGDIGQVWEAKSGTDYGAEGGWDGSNIPIDHTKMYRFAVWFKVYGNMSGSVYLGSTPNTVANLSDSQTNGNPYFISGYARNSFTGDKWYLAVGYVYPSNYGGAANIGGVFDSTTGSLVYGAASFKWVINQSTSGHRAYQYYTSASNPADPAYTLFWNPRVEVCDGTEESIASMLAMGSPSGRNKITGTNVSTYIAGAAIGWAQIGDLTINTGGGVRSGKTTYGSGTGWLIEYNNGTPRLDIGDANQYLRWTGTTLEIKLNKITLSGTTPAGGSFPKNDTIVRSLGSCTITASGGTPPYTYSWSYADDVELRSNQSLDPDTRGYASFSNNVASLSARGDNDCIVTVFASCTVVDSNGLAAVFDTAASGTFGLGPD